MDHLLSREKDIIEKHIFNLNIIICFVLFGFERLSLSTACYFFSDNKKVFEKWIIL